MHTLTYPDHATTAHADQLHGVTLTVYRTDCVLRAQSHLRSAQEF